MSNSGLVLRQFSAASLLGAILGFLLITGGHAAEKSDPIVVGLDADLTGSAASGGIAIQRGMELAIDEINEAGGVIGRSVILKVRDHRGNPARGVDNMREFAETKNLVAVFGGIHTPVALAELEVVHEAKIVFLIPWAAGTTVVENGYTPNYVFRVSVRDQFAGGFLIQEVVERGFKRPGLLLEQTGWGRSNEKAMQESLRARNMPEAPIAWFNWGVKDLNSEISALKTAGADVVLLVANAREGVVVFRDMAKLRAEERLPVVSHWGITGGNIFDQASASLSSVDLTFLQTFSFFDPPFPAKARRVFDAYCARFDKCSSPADVISPVGTAHAYDLMHLLKMAIEKAGATDRLAVRDALENLGRYEGLVRVYDPPFTAERHDALDRSDFRLSRFDRAGAIVPLEQQRAQSR